MSRKSNEYPEERKNPALKRKIADLVSSDSSNEQVISNN